MPNVTPIKRPPTPKTYTVSLGSVSFSLMLLRAGESLGPRPCTPRSKYTIFWLRKAMMGGLYYVCLPNGIKMFSMGRITKHTSQWERGVTEVKFGTSIFLEIKRTKE